MKMMKRRKMEREKVNRKMWKVKKKRKREMRKAKAKGRKEEAVRTKSQTARTNPPANPAQDQQRVLLKT